MRLCVVGDNMNEYLRKIAIEQQIIHREKQWDLVKENREIVSDIFEDIPDFNE